MSVHSPDSTPAGAEARRAAYDEPPGEGWLSFAAVMLTIVGIINFVYGIAAIDDANFYIADAEFVISDLNTWGWVILLTGVVQIVTAVGIVARNQFSRWLGVGFAGLNAIAQLLMIAAFPLWSLAVFAVDILIIYGLVVYGGREKSAL